VPQDSAILPGYIPIGIYSNNIDIARFVSKDDPGFEVICGELRRWIKQINVAERHYIDLLALIYDRDILERQRDRLERSARCKYCRSTLLIYSSY